MNWHLITSSKGGVGKTVIALLLLACSRERHGSVLIVDLNGMNADIRRLVGCVAPAGRKKNQCRWKLKPPLSREFHVEKINVNTSYMVVSWPLDAFNLFTQEDFRSFLYELAKTGKKQIEENLELTIGTIIIDTNYHFCNLFPHNRLDFFEHEVFSYFGNDVANEENFFIWFIWVFRQLKNLFQLSSSQDDDPYVMDALAVDDGAQKIEKYLRNPKLSLQETGRTTPFIHVFSPNSLQEVANKEHFSVFKQLVGAGKPPCRIISPLKALADLDGNSQAVSFVGFLEILKQIQEKCPSQPGDSAPQYFSKILEKYVLSLKDSHLKCPRNLVPLYFYEESLATYNEYDHDKMTIFTEIVKLSIYDNFKKCYDNLFL